MPCKSKPNWSSVFETLKLLFGVCLSLLDECLDVKNGVDLIARGDLYWGCLCLGTTLLPALAYATTTSLPQRLRSRFSAYNCNTIASHLPLLRPVMYSTTIAYTCMQICVEENSEKLTFCPKIKTKWHKTAIKKLAFWPDPLRGAFGCRNWQSDFKQWPRCTG